ncbi:MAG: hypothetical protein AB1815_13145 [Bacillota bacterium]
MEKQVIMYAGSEKINDSIIRRLGHKNAKIIHLSGRKNINRCLPKRISSIVVHLEYASHELAMTAKRLAKEYNIPIVFLCRGASKKVVINNKNKLVI